MNNKDPLIYTPATTNITDKVKLELLFWLTSSVFPADFYD